MGGMKRIYRGTDGASECEVFVRGNHIKLTHLNKENPSDNWELHYRCQKVGGAYVLKVSGIDDKEPEIHEMSAKDYGEARQELADYFLKEVRSSELGMPLFYDELSEAFDRIQEL